MGRNLILIGSMCVIAGPLLLIAYAVQGGVGCVTVGVALGTCLASGLLSLWLVQCAPSPDQVVHQVLLGMLPRMGIPLFACMAIYLHGGMLAESGFVYYIMTFYFVTLIVETVLLAGNARNQPTKSRTG